MDLRALDARLRKLVTERQRHESDLADLLACARAARTWLVEGFGSMERYAEARLGVSARRMYYLLSLHRMLERLADLRRAYISGRLTLRQTLLVGRVASARTAPAWIRRAGRVTLRRLEDEVDFWELLRDERPDVWERLRGGPLPEGIVLVPGHPPRLHASAPGERSGSALDGSAGLGESELHASAHAECVDQAEFSSPTDHVGTRLHASAPGERSGSALHGSARSDELDLLASARPKCGNHADFSSPTDHGGSRLHASAPREGAGPIDARSFLAALHASEGATPLPWRMGVIRILVDPDIRQMWNDTVARFRAACDEPLAEWEVLVLVVERFLRTWDNRETRRQRRENPTLERDGWRCTAPGCRSVGTGRLHEHHIEFRSQGGAVTDPRNLTTLCTGHHQHLLHAGHIRCSGDAPDGLRWWLGTSGMPGAGAFLQFAGDLRTGGTADSDRIAPAEPSAPAGDGPFAARGMLRAGVTPRVHAFGVGGRADSGASHRAEAPCAQR